MSPAADRALRQNLSDFIEAALRTPEIGAVGVGVAVVADGQPVLVQGFGHADLAAQTPYTASTVQNIGSLSKAFLSATVAWLVSRGLLQWQLPVRRYIPEFRLSDPYLTELVTVRDLLASRITIDWPLLPLPHLEDYIFPQGRHSEAWLRRLTTAPLDATKFRSEFQYDGGLMGVAAILVERVCGLPLAEVQHQILAELGMHDTSLVREFPGRIATHYQHAATGMTPISDRMMRLRPEGAPAGGMRTSIDDYARWIQFQLGTLPQTPIPADILAELHRPHVTISPSDHPLRERAGYARGLLLGYSLGWRVDLYGDRYSMFHGGSNPGIRSFARLIPSRRFGMAVFQNSDANCYELGRAVIDLVQNILFGNGAPELPARLDSLIAAVAGIRDTRAAAMAPPPPVEQVPPEPLPSYAGDYVIGGHCAGNMVVQMAGDDLQMMVGTLRLGLHPWRGDMFHATYLNDFLGPYAASGGEFRDLKLAIHFKRNARGAIIGFEMSDGVDTAVAQRAKGAVRGVRRPAS